MDQNMPERQYKPIPPLSQEQQIRFWSKVNIKGPDECWEWVGSHVRKGYGNVRIGRGGYRANRVALAIFSGRDEPSMIAMHSCDNAGCANPSHLSWGTEFQNNQDAIQRGRIRRGSRNGKSRLTEDSVAKIRALRTMGFGIHALAEIFGVHHGTIWAVVARKTWRHVA
jgi:hypothetical protein